MSKFCGHCGSTLADNATFCPNCGAPAVDQAAPAQFNQPQQFNQPAFGGAPAMGAVQKPGMGKGAKMAIIIGAAAIAVGLIVWLLIVLLGGGMETPIKDQLKAYEKTDYSLFKDSMTAKGAFKEASESSVPSESTFASHRSRLAATYGDDFKIEYSIIEKEKVDASSYLGLVDEVQKVKCEFVITGSKKTGKVTKTFRCIKAGGKWCLSSYLF